MEIPNFTLQPLIENSLLHGLKDRKYCGTIILKIYRIRDEKPAVSIWIIDDGIGMPEEKLAELNAYCRERSLYRTRLEQQEEAAHLGIINVISRLKLYYQEDCEICYSKNEMGGTSVNIQIKIEREQL